MNYIHQNDMDNFVDNIREEILAKLEKIVNMDSASDNKKGQMF